MKSSNYTATALESSFLLSFSVLEKAGPFCDEFPVEITTNSSPTPSVGPGKDVENQKKRMDNGIVQQSGVILGQKHELVPDMTKSGPEMGQQPQKIKSTNIVTYYGSDNSEQISIELKDLKSVSNKIKK